MSKEKQEKKEGALGREFATVLEMSQNGKKVDNEPKKGGGVCSIRMRKKVSFAGDRAAAIKELEKAYPGVKFEWGD